jgi:hypothetical protein
MPDRPATEEGTNAVLARLRSIIAEHRWAVMFVGAGFNEPNFHYTVGLTAQGLPELIVFGLPHDVGHAILNDLAQRTVDDRPPFTNGERLDDVAVGYDIVMLDSTAAGTERAPSYLAELVAFEDGNEDLYRVQQAVMPDRQGRFPWDEGYDMGFNVPILGAP